MVVRQVHALEVAGSIPAVASNFMTKRQLIEKECAARAMPREVAQVALEAVMHHHGEVILAWLLAQQEHYRSMAVGPEVAGASREHLCGAAYAVDSMVSAAREIMLREGSSRTGGSEYNEVPRSTVDAS